MAYSNQERLGTKNIFTDSPVSMTVITPLLDDIGRNDTVIEQQASTLFGRVLSVDYDAWVATVQWENGEVRVHRLGDLTSEEP